MTKPSILVISFSHLGTDPRVNRQLRLLQAGYRVTAAGYADPGIAGVEFIPLPARAKQPVDRVLAAWRLKTGRYLDYYWAIDTAQAGRAALKDRAFDLILANDSTAWPLAAEIRGRARVLCDAHEYTPREFEDIWWWRVFHQPFKTWLSRTYLPQADGMLTVCPGIAEEYQRVIGVAPQVVMNVPPQQRGLTPSPTPPDRVRMIHHGGATRSRKIENMIRMFAHLDRRFSLDLMLVGSEPRYLQGLRELARGEPRIRFLEPVPMREIPARINTYDLGLYLLEPNSFNNLHALPNKFFEFIQARLGVAIGPSPEMARLVREHACGVVAADFSPTALASSLQPLDATQIDAWKRQAHRAAEVLCWENESRVLLREIERVLSLGPCAA